MDYMTLKEAAEKWGVTPRRVNYYCAGGDVYKRQTHKAVHDKYLKIGWKSRQAAYAEKHLSLIHIYYARNIFALFQQKFKS